VTAASPLILHVRCVTGAGGGPEKTILNSPRFLARLGYDCACAYLHPPDDPGFDVLRRRADAAEARLVGIPDRGPLDLGVVRRMARLCREERVAVWHGHDYKSNALGLLVRWYWPMKLATTVHGWVQHTRRTPLYYAIDRFCLKRYDEILCVSQDLYDQCLRLGVRPERCHWVHNGIDTEQFTRRQKAAAARRAFSRHVSGQLIGAMGRLSDEKGFDLLIDAVDRLLNEGYDISLWIAGEGAQRASLQKLIDDRGQSSRIQLLGHVEDTQSFYEALDLFALSSRREGLPNVLLEAMALEVPVVATRIAGVPTLVEDGVSGLLVEPGDSVVLAGALRQVLGDAALRDCFAAAARQTIETTFSFERRMRRVAGIYDALLARKPAAAQAAAHHA